MKFLIKLPIREKDVLMLRFFEDKTQSEIAKAMNLSQVQISRIERAALHRLRQILNDETSEK